MSKIEEIKERADKEEYVKRDIDYYEAQEDIQYLLSRLEIAEKALTRLSTGNFSAPMEYTQIEAYQKYAESALDRIREE